MYARSKATAVVGCQVKLCFDLAPSIQELLEMDQNSGPICSTTLHNAKPYLENPFDGSIPQTDRPELYGD